MCHKRRARPVLIAGHVPGQVRVFGVAHNAWAAAGRGGRCALPLCAAREDVGDDCGGRVHRACRGAVVDYYDSRPNSIGHTGSAAWAVHWQVHTNFYGTSKAAVSSVSDSGRICILDIDIQGVKTVKALPDFGAQCDFASNHARRPLRLAAQRSDLLSASSSLPHRMSRRSSIGCAAGGLRRRRKSRCHSGGVVCPMRPLVRFTLDLMFTALELFR